MLTELFPPPLPFISINLKTTQQNFSSPGLSPLLWLNQNRPSPQDQFTYHRLPKACSNISSHICVFTCVCMCTCHHHTSWSSKLNKGQNCMLIFLCIPFRTWLVLCIVFNFYLNWLASVHKQSWPPSFKYNISTIFLWLKQTLWDSVHLPPSFLIFSHPLNSNLPCKCANAVYPLTQL